MAQKSATRPIHKQGAAKPLTVSKTTGPRKRKAREYKSFRVSRRIRHTDKPLQGAFKLFRQTLRTCLKFWRPLFLILLVYAVLQLFFVRGFSSGFNMSVLKDALLTTFTGHVGQLFTGFTLFATLLTNPGNDAQGISGIYQTLLVVVMSLAFIWAIRQLMSGVKIRLRDPFYKGMYPLVPFLLVFVVMALQTLPLLAGGFLYSSVTNQGIAVTLLEKALWLLLFILLALLSVYMLTSSAFALYIVTLPEMTPMKALRSARQLVLNRRWTVMRKVIFLPFILLLSAFLIMLPFVLWLTAVSSWVFFVLTIAGVAVLHIYMYTLYRELL